MTRTSDLFRYTGGKAPDSPELLIKIRFLSPVTQSVLYVLLRKREKMTPLHAKGVTVADVQGACSSYSFDEMGPEQAIQAGVVELEKYGHVARG